MTDNPRVQEINLLVGICVFGAFVIAAALFVIGIAGHRPPPAPTEIATTTAS